MILTGKAAKYAEVAEEELERLGAKKAELTEDEQIRLYKITRSFELDPMFRAYMSSCSDLFVTALVQGRMEEMIGKLKKVVLEFI